MKKISKLVVLLMFSLVCWGAASVQMAGATTIEFKTPAGSSTSGGPVNAEAFFTLDPANHKITITLTDLYQNPRADTQLISGLMFVVSGTGSDAVTTVNSGMISTINANGSYSTAQSDPLTRWTATPTGTQIYLTTLSGGPPNRLIIGPDSADGFNHAGSYSNANPSITNKHNPSVLGSATFDITVPWLTQTSTISNVYFKFGTENDKTSDVVQGVHAPLPATVLLFGSGLVGVGLLGRRRLRS